MKGVLGYLSGMCVGIALMSNNVHDCLGFVSAVLAVIWFVEGIVSYGS
jgi:hypothetical protein